MRDIELQEIISGAVKGNYRRGIYFLLHAGEIVYVGQSKNVLGRFNEHILIKTFDSYFVLELEDDEDLLAAEMHFIEKFKPKYNKTKPSSFVFFAPESELPFDRVIERLAAGQSLYGASKAEGFNPNNFPRSSKFKAWKNKNNIDEQP